MASSSDRRSNVLYIGGLPRSGSTVLGNVLNEADGFFHAGELCSAWGIGLRRNSLCGCGEPFRSCPVWRQVFEQAFGSIEAVRGYRGKRPSSRDVMLRLVGLGRLANDLDPEYLQRLEQLYRAIHDVTGCRVIVDSSKFPAHAYLLRQIPSIDLRILHLIRDPRGTAYSWQQKVVRTDVKRDKTVEMPRFSLPDTSLKWLLYNWETEAMGREEPARYLRLRYEDFVSDPARRVREILTFVGEDPAHAPAVRDGKVELGTNHTVMGNPNRAKLGPVQLRPDERWRGGMSRRDRATVNLFSWPLMLRYQYRIFGR